MSDEQLVTVYEADSKAEAAIIESILKQSGIATTIHLMGASGVESHQIQVGKSLAAKAEQVILDYRSPDDQE